MPLTPGTRLGPYDILAPLGAGGMGEVYRAHDPRLGRDVAIKVLPQAVAADPDRLARFEREARAVAALTHPNIVTLHSIEEAGGVRFLTMELVDGSSLDHLVTPSGLPLPRLLDLAIPLARALVAAHERGVVHRDLKPANVMVTRDGTVKVLDFGLAKLTGAEPAADVTVAVTRGVPDSPLSNAGQVMGTVPYMSPEQVRGADADARSDLFAFGIILYELATGRRPFAGASSADVSSAILRDTPPPPQALRGDLPSDLHRIVTRCLEKDPRARFQTALDVANELGLVKRTMQGTAEAPRPAAPADSPSIAVLPFVNRSRDEEDEYFSDGLADELLNVLAKIRGLRVAARTSSFQFKGRTDDLATIGHKLNVATLLEGSVRKAGNRVRIAVQLIKVADGFHLWSETYDRTLEDIFAVQDDIAQCVVRELRTTLLGATADTGASGEVKAEVARAAKGRARDPESHRLFLQGRFFVRRLVAADLAHGVTLLHQAIDKDPDNAIAWATLSWAETIRTNFGEQEVGPGIRAAREAAHRALALEPDLPEAHIALGMIQLWHDFDQKGAEVSLRRVSQLAPDHPDVLFMLAVLDINRKRMESAIAFAERAVDLDPLSVAGYGILARVMRGAGRPQECERACRKALEIAPDAVPMRLILGLALSDQGRFDEALAEVLLEKADWARLCGEGIVYEKLGRHDESTRALRQLTEARAADAAVQIAMVHAARGESDAAFPWLERAFAQRDSGLAFIRALREFQSLHADPRWLPFLRKLGHED